jgi:hypothetical protein
MDRPCNTAQTVCTRCQDNPRLPHQRWCRSCLTEAQRERRAARRAAQAEAAQALHAVTRHSQALQRLPQAPTAPAQAPAPPRSHDISQALQAYRAAMHEYHVVARRPWPLLPPTPDLRIRHLWQRVQLSKQRWLAMQE